MQSFCILSGPTHSVSHCWNPSREENLLPWMCADPVTFSTISIGVWCTCPTHGLVENLGSHFHLYGVPGCSRFLSVAVIRHSDRKPLRGEGLFQLPGHKSSLRKSGRLLKQKPWRVLLVGSLRLTVSWPFRSPQASLAWAVPQLGLSSRMARGCFKPTVKANQDAG